MLEFFKKTLKRSKTKSKSPSKSPSQSRNKSPSKSPSKSRNNLIELEKSHFEINDNSYETKIKSHNSFGILFVHVDWCPYCIEALPIMKELSKELKSFNLPLYSANLTNDRYLPFIESFPSIYYVNSDGFLEVMETDRTVLSLFNLFINMIVNNMNPNAEIANKMPHKLDDILQHQQSLHIDKSLYNNTHAIQLTDSNIILNDVNKLSIKDDMFANPGLLKAYASWCIHCQNSVNKIKYLSNKFNIPGENMNIYVIEMSENKDSLLNNIVAGFPTYLYIDEQKQINELNGELMYKNQKLKQIMDFIQSRE
jgi:thiol-disulfide isomerase/thioredoxin